MKTAHNVGIYCRLSREDLKNGKKDVSLSIENQQAIIEAFVNEKGWNIYTVYIDDDVTGTTFKRRDFQKMIADIEAGKIDCVITKDLSRLGRNYIEAGRYRELFTEYGVRYIAIHDNHDSADDDAFNITTPIKEIINEMYAADVSRKVRSTKKLMAEQGKFANSRAPYGYMKSPENKHVLVVDENVAHNVVRIFEMYLDGKTARAIADVFNSENIVTANEYYYSAIGKPNPFRNNKNRWGSASVMNIIKNPVYYGAMANGKRKVVSFKNHNVVKNDFDEWIIVEDTHEPLVSKEHWQEAQQIHLGNKKDTVRRRRVSDEVSVFAGILKCADCGGNMALKRRPNKTIDTKEFYKCGTYAQKGKNVCSAHTIDFDVLCEAVLKDIQRYAVLAAEDEEKLIDQILKANNTFQYKNVARYEKTIRESKNRIREIDKMLRKLFEEKVCCGIDEATFKRLSKTYTEEQTRLIYDTEQLEAELDECKNVQRDMSGLVQRIKECLTIDTLTRAIVVDLINEIKVSETYTVDGERNVDIEIVYKFGQIPDEEKEPGEGNPTTDHPSTKLYV